MPQFSNCQGERAVGGTANLQGQDGTASVATAAAAITTETVSIIIIIIVIINTTVSVFVVLMSIQGGRRPSQRGGGQKHGQEVGARHAGGNHGRIHFSSAIGMNN